MDVFSWILHLQPSKLVNMGEVLDRVLLGGGEPEYGVVSELSEAARGVFGSCGWGGGVYWLCEESWTHGM